MIKNWLIISPSTGKFVEYNSEDKPFDGAILIPDGAEIAISHMGKLVFLKDNLSMSVFEDGKDWTPTNIQNPQSYLTRIKYTGLIKWERILNCQQSS